MTIRYDRETARICGWEIGRGSHGEMRATVAEYNQYVRSISTRANLSQCVLSPGTVTFVVREDA